MDPADTQYLKRTVGEALAKGMAQVLLHQPADPVAALGSFLVHFADFHEQNVQTQAAIQQFLHDDSAAAAAALEKQQKEEQAAAKRAEFATEAEFKLYQRKQMREQVAQALAPAVETVGPVEQYLNALVRSATEALKTVSPVCPQPHVHVARLNTLPTAQQCVYVASTQDCMHEQVIDNTEKTGLMFETMPVPSEDEAEVNAALVTDSAEAPAEVKSSFFPQLSIANLLMDLKAHKVRYFGGKRGAGSLSHVVFEYASPMLVDSIKSVADALNDPTLEGEAFDAKKTELDAAKATQAQRFLLTVETVNATPAAGVGGLAALTLTENQLAAAQTVAKVIVQQLTQREQRDFWTEVDLQRANVERFATFVASETAAEITSVRAELPVETATEQVEYVAAKNKIGSMIQVLKDGLCASLLLRGGDAAESVVDAVLQLCGYQTSQYRHSKTKAFDWHRARHVLLSALDQLASLQPESADIDNDAALKQQYSASLALVQALNMDELRVANYPVYEIGRFVSAVGKLYALLAEQRRIAEEKRLEELRIQEEARLAAEAEAARVAAEAAEAARLEEEKRLQEEQAAQQAAQEAAAAVEGEAAPAPAE